MHLDADDMMHLGKKARVWGKKRLERDGHILGDGNESSVLPADFILPHENVYPTPPESVSIELKSFELMMPVDSVHPSPLCGLTGTPMRESNKAPELPSYPARIVFSASSDGKSEELVLTLAYDINFVTAHPCSPSRHVRFVKSPSSPTIQQIDVSGSAALGKGSKSAYRAGKFHGAPRWM